MGTYFSEREFEQVEPAENAFRSPIPTQVISNGEFNPIPQTPRQKQVEACIKELADTYGAKLGMDRRQFLRTGCGMAAAFLAMNSVHGKLFDVSEAEAADVAMAQERAGALQGQFVFDVQTHFVRDDYTQEGFLGFLKHGAEIWKTGDPNKITLYNVKFENYVRQIYLNSDTAVALLSGAPFDDKSWEFLTNQAIAEAVKMVNRTAGSTRLLGHAVVTPGQPGWMDEVDRALAERPPASWKMYTIGDPLSAKTMHPFRLDDEQLMYGFYEKIDKAGIRNICIHKGLMPADYEESWAGVWKYQTPWDLLKVAKDWPQLNFIIYHGCFRPWMDAAGAALAHLRRPATSSGLPTSPECRKRQAPRTCMPRWAPVSPARRWSTRFSRRRCWAPGSRVSAPATWCGAPTRYFTARRSGRSRPCAGSRSLKTCGRSMALRLSVRPTAR